MKYKFGTFKQAGISEDTSSQFVLKNMISMIPDSFRQSCITQHFADQVAKTWGQLKENGQELMQAFFDLYKDEPAFASNLYEVRQTGLKQAPEEINLLINRNAFIFQDTVNHGEIWHTIKLEHIKEFGAAGHKLVITSYNFGITRTVNIKSHYAKDAQMLLMDYCGLYHLSKELAYVRLT